MDKNDRLRYRKIAAWTIAGIFVLGFFIAPVGAVTGPVMGAWFVGTQRPRRGFLWMLGFALLFGLPDLWRGLTHGGAGAALVYAGWTLAAMVLGVLPFTFHRITGLHSSGFVSTLALPVYAVLCGALRAAWLPSGVAGNFGAGVPVFLIYWFAAVLIWAWNREFRLRTIRPGATLFTAVCVSAVLFEQIGRVTAGQSRTLAVNAGLVWLCLAAAVGFAIRQLLLARQRPGWQCRPDTLAILRDPVSGEGLHLVKQGRDPRLASSKGERIPFFRGIPDLRRPGDLTGANEKYNHLYETIGGFYDDIQRFVSAFTGIDRDAYVMSYLGLLEVKPGDSVLETSVGTGLNFKYLPKGTSLTGIDLSPEMLINCQSNLHRRGLSADLFLGNAECLPFADCSFDVVFHVGGINFFNDRARAIREMIRVARPGSRILIADETEEHVKATFERGPVTSGYFKNRKQPVTAPLDLVPGDMRETHLEILNVVGKNRFYALTFRKPARAGLQESAAL